MDKHFAAVERLPPLTLVLYDGQVRSACGMDNRRWAHLLSGDEKLYIDLAFFRDLQVRFQAQATSLLHVIAHEVGHHAKAHVPARGNHPRARF